MFVKDFYVLISILPQDIINNISDFIENPYLESRRLRTESIKNFIKDMIKLDLYERGYKNLENAPTANDNILGILLNSTNENFTDNFLIDSVLFNKLESIECLNLDSFLKRYKTIDDFSTIPLNKSYEIILEDYKYLLYKPRLRDYAKPEYLYDIEDLNIENPSDSNDSIFH
tara:strand:- start:202 stop:717 length:516 start_codon:yes stop_codon:yes gene_type:complete